MKGKATMMKLSEVEHEISRRLRIPSKRLCLRP